ncbi:MAG: PAS domain S-box protein [Blastocatellia bacterium]|nr:PAS domain S-box protein [Blastocatellia bacterium]
MTTNLGRLLVVDDEENLLKALCRGLSNHGYEAVGFTSGHQAQEALRSQSFDILLTDLMMPDTDGIRLLKESMEIDPSLIGIVMTGQGTIASAVEAMKVGAFDYVLKPFKLSSLLPVLARAVEFRRLKLENLQLQETVAIYELTQAVAFSLDVNTIVNKMADAALEQCKADEASILLSSGDEKNLYIAAVRGGGREAILGKRVPEGNGIAGWVAANREPLLLQGEVSDSRFAPLRVRPDIRSAISMPLLAGGALVGVLNVSATSRRRPFSMGELKALSVLASAGALALKSAWLYTAVLEAKDDLNALIEAAPLAVIALDLDLNVTTWNRGAERIFGWSRQEVLGHRTPLVPDERWAEFESYRELLLRGEPSVAYESRRKKKDGSAVDVSISAAPLPDADGNVNRYMAMIADITERKQMEAALQESEERLARTEEFSLVMVAHAGLDGRWLKVPHKLCELLGRMESELLGHSFKEVTHPDDFKGFWDQCQRLIGGEMRSFDLEKRYVRKDRKVLWVYLNCSIVTDAEDNPVHFLTYIRDITHNKELEEQLAQSQKMEAIGRLAGGVAHDFNNLLTAILGYSQIVRNRLDPTNPLRSEIEEIEKAGNRAAALTNQLLAFSRRQVIQPKALNLNTVVADVEKMLRRLIGEDIELTLRLDQEIGYVKADLGQIEQIIVNLAVNARDAMPKGGRLAIETANVSLDEPYTDIHSQIPPGRYVRLAISDTGIGMDKETQLLIFDPFFTTKERGKGTGLGLSTVYGIMKQSDSHITLESEPGRGTAFKLFFPLVETSSEASKTARAKAESVKGSETILLVEDEEAVRKLARLVLEMNSYSILEASNADEAITLYELHKGAIQLIITDIVMPGKSGGELISSLKLPSSETKILYMSGYTPDAIASRGVLDADVPFLRKPFTPADLTSKVREALDGLEE